MTPHEAVDMEWTQPPHCCAADQSECGRLRVTVEDGGGGPYLVLNALEWSLDEADIESLAGVLRGILAAHEAKAKREAEMEL